MTWPESVDEALCFGWIDGVRRSLGAERYTIRFTPRRPGSHWSRVNVDLVARLEAEGRMTDAGRAAYAARREDRTARFSYEQAAVALDADQESFQRGCGGLVVVLRAAALVPDPGDPLGDQPEATRHAGPAPGDADRVFAPAVAAARSSGADARRPGGAGGSPRWYPPARPAHGVSNQVKGALIRSTWSAAPPYASNGKARKTPCRPRRPRSGRRLPGVVGERRRRRVRSA